MGETLSAWYGGEREGRCLRGTDSVWVSFIIGVAYTIYRDVR